MLNAVSLIFKDKYDKYYEGESEWRDIGAISKANNIQLLCNNYVHKKILDIGSGEGAVLSELSKNKFAEQISSIELSESAVSAIKKRKINSLVECKVFNGSEIPYEDKTFDLVTISHVIEHLEYPRKIIYEAARVGKLVFLEIPIELNTRLKEDYVYDNVGHINFYSIKLFRQLIKSCNLSILGCMVTNSSWATYQFIYKRTALLHYFPKELLLRVSPKFATWLWTYNYSVLCAEK